MTWFKVDDSFYDHPKVYDASDAAIALWTRAGSWSARNLTNGVVPSGMLARLSGDGELAARELCDRGLWRRTRGGFEFHDWADYQPTKERVEADRAAAAARQQKYRDRQRNPSSPDPPSRRYSRVNNTSRDGVSHTTPTRPDPPPTGERVGGARASPAHPDPPHLTGCSYANTRTPATNCAICAAIRMSPPDPE